MSERGVSGAVLVALCALVSFWSACRIWQAFEGG